MVWRRIVRGRTANAMDTDPTIQTQPLGDILVEHIPFFRIAPNGVIVQANRAVGALLGIDGLYKANVASALAAHPALLSSIQSTLHDKVPYRSRLVHIEREQWSSSVLADALSVDGAWLFVFHEIENIASLEGRMNDRGRLAMLGKIASGIAHEIRNPLTTISGFTQIMRENFTCSGMQKEIAYTDQIAAELARIEKLVDNLLLLSRLEPMRFEAVNVQSFLNELEMSLQAYATARNVKLCVVSRTVPDISADGALLRKAVMHLAFNAVESMENGGELSLSSSYSTEESFVWMHVADTGPGIPNYLMDRIFDAFFTTKDTGFGLGLPICQRIIADLGGQIRVQNKGYGTTFSVALPIAARSDDGSDIPSAVP